MADNLTATCELMSRHLTTLQVSKACYRHSFTSFVLRLRIAREWYWQKEVFYNCKATATIKVLSHDVWLFIQASAERKEGLHLEISSYAVISSGYNEGVTGKPLSVIAPRSKRGELPVHPSGLWGLVLLLAVGDSTNVQSGMAASPLLGFLGKLNSFE
jgi:hypothetical protein